MAIKICLDAGHYGKYNRSPAVNTYYESEMNWKLHLLLKEELEAYGIEVITTRAEKDKDLDLVSRGKASEGCDLFLSIHSNAVGSETNDSVDYPLAIVQLDGKGNTLGEALADCIHDTMGTKQSGRVWTRRGSAGGEYYGVLWGAAKVGTVGMILEHSFHTCTKSAKWLSDDANLSTLAKDEAKVIADHFGVKKPVEPSAPVYKPTVKEWQQAAIADGFKFPKYGADGLWGAECASVAKSAVCKKRATYEYQNLTRIVQKVVGVSVDGLFGNHTKAAVIAYQKKHGLEADGCVGINTWKVILGV